ncbi:hypothetical protein RFI_17908 [Reticulomyxa filosa]|uniref:Uncharacterized protein n=1 Tax=Reticulomyxa filosa TaxID=46433 RepID=X6MZU3_RETFI|nr:hypothetical protein RFI_17908 [Reticulomyxa filosa]|eukprot:ETO19326.1 hypothetical protein RFI_17908 [Reticulomyxa filosa]
MTVCHQIDATVNQLETRLAKLQNHLEQLNKGQLQRTEKEHHHIKSTSNVTSNSFDVPFPQEPLIVHSKEMLSVFLKKNNKKHAYTKKKKKKKIFFF